MNINEFVDSLPHESFFELMRACTDRMASEISSLEYEEEEVADEEEESASTITNYSPTTTPSRGPAQELLNVLPAKNRAVVDVELTKNEKDLARNNEYIVAIKSLRERRPDLKLMQCRDVVEKFMLKENIPTPRQRKAGLA